MIAEYFQARARRDDDGTSECCRRLHRNLQSTAWRHKKVAPLPGAIGFGAAGSASHLSQAGTHVTSGHQPDNKDFVVATRGNLPLKKDNKKRNSVGGLLNEDMENGRKQLAWLGCL